MQKYWFREFKVANAYNPPSFNMQFDLVFSHSVFQYFPNEEFAFEVIRKLYDLILKGGRLCLLDINDKDFEAKSTTLRKKSFNNDEEFYKFYKGLDHLFYQKKN